MSIKEIEEMTMNVAGGEGHEPLHASASSTTVRGWTPGGVRSEMEKIQAQVSALEADLSAMITRGAIGYVETRHELVEASDALHRAVEILDNNYSKIS
jgi:hypothetical protein